MNSLLKQIILFVSSIIPDNYEIWIFESYVMNH